METQNDQAVVHQEACLFVVGSGLPATDRFLTAAQPQHRDRHAQQQPLYAGVSDVAPERCLDYGCRT